MYSGIVTAKAQLDFLAQAQAQLDRHNFLAQAQLDFLAQAKPKHNWTF